MILKNKLKEYMKNYNINQKELASLLDVSQSHLSKVLKGKKSPGAKVADAYFRLPGILESKKINDLRELVNTLFLNEEINEETAKRILFVIEP